VFSFSVVLFFLIPTTMTTLRRLDLAPTFLSDFGFCMHALNHRSSSIAGYDRLTSTHKGITSGWAGATT